MLDKVKFYLKDIHTQKHSDQTFLTPSISKKRNITDSKQAVQLRKRKIGLIWMTKFTEMQFSVWKIKSNQITLIESSLRGFLDPIDNNMNTSNTKLFKL